MQSGDYLADIDAKFQHLLSALNDKIDNHYKKLSEQISNVENKIDWLNSEMGSLINSEIKLQSAHHNGGDIVLNRTPTSRLETLLNKIKSSERATREIYINGEPLNHFNLLNDFNNKMLMKVSLNVTETKARQVPVNFEEENIIAQKESENLNRIQTQLGQIFGLEFSSLVQFPLPVPFRCHPHPVDPSELNLEQKFTDIISNPMKRVEDIVQKNLKNWFENLPEEDSFKGFIDLSLSNQDLPCYTFPRYSQRLAFEMSGKPDFLSIDAPLTLEIKVGGSEIQSLGQMDTLNNQDYALINQCLERVYCQITLLETLKHAVSVCANGEKAWIIIATITVNSENRRNLNMFEKLLDIKIDIISLKSNYVYPIISTLLKNKHIFFTEKFHQINYILNNDYISPCYFGVKYYAYGRSTLFAISLFRQPSKSFNESKNILNVTEPDFIIKISTDTTELTHLNEAQFIDRISGVNASRYVIKIINSRLEPTHEKYIGIPNLPEIFSEINSSKVQMNIKHNLSTALDKMYPNNQISLETKNELILKSWLTPIQNFVLDSSMIFIMMYAGQGLKEGFDLNFIQDSTSELENLGVLQGDPRAPNMQYIENIPLRAFDDSGPPITSFLIDYDNAVLLNERGEGFIEVDTNSMGAIQQNLKSSYCRVRNIGGKAYYVYTKIVEIHLAINEFQKSRISSYLPKLTSSLSPLPTPMPSQQITQPPIHK